MIPLFKFNKSIIIRTFDLPTLMSTKIRAVLRRKWEKTDKSGQTIAKVKGRDYFDLMWYLEKGVRPNIKCVDDVRNIADLKKELLKSIERVDSSSILIDLKPLIDDEKFIKNLSTNIKDILRREIREKL